jgi:hypothetical protein
MTWLSPEQTEEARRGKRKIAIAYTPGSKRMNYEALAGLPAGESAVPAASLSVPCFTINRDPVWRVMYVKTH